MFWIKETLHIYPTHFHILPHLYILISYHLESFCGKLLWKVFLQLAGRKLRFPITQLLVAFWVQHVRKRFQNIIYCNSFYFFRTEIVFEVARKLQAKNVRMLWCHTPSN